MERHARFSRTKTLTLIAATMTLASLVSVPEASAETSKMEVKGPVTEVSGSCPSLQFKVGKQTISTHDKTDFDDGNCPEIANGRVVEVEGKIGAQGNLEAREVDLK